MKMQKQPRIALDLDGVIANFHQELVRVYNSLYEDNLSIEDFDGDFETLEHSIYERLIHIFNEPEFFKNLRPLPGVIEHISKYSDYGFEVIVCTAPARRLTGLINGLTASEKFDWIQKWLPFWGNDVVITKHKYLVKADILVDDMPANIVTWCEENPNGIGLLIAAPWNRNFMHLPNNAILGELADILNIVEKFWCLERGQLVFRYDELAHWRK